MAIQTQPSRISEPFAGSGTKNVIPATNSMPSASQAASWASGFPPECSQPVSAGGCPVPRNDFNGILNQLSQDYAFRQDGGIWAWSALADYDTGRIVQGSDGLLYQSVAQSGPGFGAGSQDPVTDTANAYWTAPHVPTMPAIDSSAAIASTQWVNDWQTYNQASPAYYVATNGSDSNDGKSATRPKKTVANVISTIKGAKGSLPDDINIYISAGTYSEQLSNSVYGTQIHFYGPSSGFASFNGAALASPGAITAFHNRIDFSSPAYIARGSVLTLSNGSYVNFSGLSASFSFYVYANGVVNIYAGDSVTVNYSGANTFALGTVTTRTGGRVIVAGSLTASVSSGGSVSGNRFSCAEGSGISGTGSATLLPGTSAGTTDSTSYYS